MLPTAGVRKRYFGLPGFALTAALVLLVVLVVFFVVQGLDGTDSQPDGTVDADAFALLAVSGNGVSIGHGHRSPNAFDGTDFGRVNRLGEAFLALRIFAIRNDGTAPLQLDEVSVPDGFILVGTPPSVVAPGERATFRVQLDLDAQGVHAGEIRIFSNDRERSPFTFQVAGMVESTQLSVLGNGVDIADGDATPSLADHTDFGVVAGGSAFVRTYTIRNHGSLPLTLGPVRVPDGFVLARTPASAIAPGGSTIFQVRTDPEAEGIRDGTIAIGLDAADASPFSFSIRATIVPPVPVISVSGNDVAITPNSTPSLDAGTDFGSYEAGDFSPVIRQFVVRNDGGATLELGNIEVPAGFSVVSRPTFPIGPGQGALFQVRFDGEDPATWAGTVRVYNTSEQNPFVFPIQAVVGEQPRARIQVAGNDRNVVNGRRAASLDDHTDFGRAILGGAPIVRTFVVRNSGGTELTLGDVSVPDGFTLVGPPPGAVAPGGSAVLQVQLDTATEGVKAGAIQFDHDAINAQPFSFWLQGTVGGSTPFLTVTGGQAGIAPGSSAPQAGEYTYFGRVEQGSDPSATVRVFTLRNEGREPLILDAVQVPAGFAIVRSPATMLEPGASTELHVQINTTTAGTRLGSIAIFSNDDRPGPFAFSVRGHVDGSDPAATANRIGVFGNNRSIADGAFHTSLADHTDFGIVGQGGVAVRSFTIRNVGHTPLALGTVAVPDGFTLTAAPAGRLAAGESTILRVRLDTDAVGTKSGAIRIDDGEGRALYSFSIQGAVIDSAPVIAVVGNGIGIVSGGNTPNLSNHTHFGSVPRGQASLRTFTIRNDGQAPLAVGEVSISGDFVLVQPPADSVDPGGSTTFQVRLDTDDVGSKSGTVRIDNSDEARGPFVFSILGLVTIPTWP